MDTITISDDDEDSPRLGEVSVQVIGEFDLGNKDQSVIDLTDGDESFKQTVKDLSRSEGYYSPEVQSPPLLPPPTPSPPLVATPTPSPTSSPLVELSSQSVANNRASSPLTGDGSTKGRKRPSPSERGNKLDNSFNDNPIKSSKVVREEARKLKQQKLEEEKLLRLAKRQNGVGRQNQNCTTIVDIKVFDTIDDSGQNTFDVLFSESGLHYEVEESDDTRNTITWMYKQTEVESSQLVEKCRKGHWTIVVISGSDYLKKITAYRDDPEDPQSLKSFICDILEQNTRDSRSNVILLIYKLAEVLKAERLKEAKNYRKTFKDKFEASDGSRSYAPISARSILSIGPQDLQDLRLTLEIDVRYHNPNWKIQIEFFERTDDVVNSIIGYTRSMAKANTNEPNMTELGVDWAIQADKDKAIDPTRSTDDLRKLWVRQLQQFTSITLPIANAIATEYPSPMALLDQYKQLDREAAEALLAEVYVQKNFRRQVGQNVSRRIHCFMTSKDPNVRIAYGEDFLTSRESPKKDELHEVISL